MESSMAWRYFFALASIHSRGVAILIHKGFDFKYKSFRSDEEARYLILKASVQDTSFRLVNVYAPNITTEQSQFFLTLSDLPCKVFLAGILSCFGLPRGKPILDEILMENDLVDIWRIQNPNSKKKSLGDKKSQLFKDVWIISL